MKTVGIIAEYNPFHNGHLYHLTEARKKTAADYAVVVMSPDFTQRGEPAIVDKWIRARMALEAGADLVLELPVRHATGSAEYFARGGVSLLTSLGIVDALSFGIEGPASSSQAHAADDVQNVLKVLTDAAEYYHRPETDEFRSELRDHLSAGRTYAQARNDAYMKLTGAVDPSGLLKTPNNVLAVEYIKAILETQSGMSVVPVPRKGAGYHDTLLSGSGSFASASGIREALLKHEAVSAYVPEKAHSLLMDELHAERFVTSSDLDLLLHDALLRNEERLEEYQDVGTDLANRIRHLLGGYTGFEQFTGQIKTRQITHTRVRRALLHILLGIRSVPAGDAGQSTPAYARVLGFRRTSQLLLRRISETSSVRLITKLPDRVPEGLAEDLRAAHLWEMVVCHKTGRPLLNEYQRQLVIL